VGANPNAGERSGRADVSIFVQRYLLLLGQHPHRVSLWEISLLQNVVGVIHEREKIIQAMVKIGLGHVQVWGLTWEVFPPKPTKTAYRVWARCSYTEWNEGICLIDESHIALDITGLQEQVFYRVDTVKKTPQVCFL